MWERFGIEKALPLVFATFFAFFSLGSAQVFANSFRESKDGKKVASVLGEYFATSEPTEEVMLGLTRLNSLMLANSRSIRVLAWEAYQAGVMRSKLEGDYESDRVTSGKYVSPYLVRQVGKKPDSGWPLFIAMHGGGGAPKRLNDSQWRIMERYYHDHDDKGGYLYLALRAPTDEWNGFYTGYVYPLIAKLIRQFLLFGDVDSNKVFVMGYSHGGYGAFAIGPKMADRFAAIHSSAAAPTDRESSPKNLRNTPFTFMIGDQDNGYGRLKRCLAFDEAIRKLRGNRDDVYPVKMILKRGFGHVGLPDREWIARMAMAKRDPVPRHLVWEPTDSVVRRFAWLEIPKPAKKQLVEASCEKNEVRVNLANVNAMNLYLDERLVDFRKPVIVRLNGKKVVNRMLAPSLLTLCRTLDERGDPELAFSVKGSLPIQ